MSAAIARRLVWLGIAALVGCGAPARAKMEHTLLAIPGQNILFLDQYIAADLHLWESRELDVKVVNIIGVGAMNAVIAGSADFSISSGASIARAAARGQKLVALLTAVNQSGQDVVLRKDIAEAAHFDPAVPLAQRAQVLKGRTIAVSGIGAIPDVVLKVVAREAGIAPDQMVVTPMQPPEFMAAFARKAIDGFSNSPPFIQQVVQDGTGVIISDAAKGEPTQYSPVAATLLLTRAPFCGEHRSVCAKMVEGMAPRPGSFARSPRMRSPC